MFESTALFAFPGAAFPHPSVELLRKWAASKLRSLLVGVLCSAFVAGSRKKRLFLVIWRVLFFRVKTSWKHIMNLFSCTVLLPRDEGRVFHPSGQFCFAHVSSEMCCNTI
jgi:hypothetical protein